MKQSNHLKKVFASKTFAPKYSAGLGHYTPQVKLINTKGGTGFDKIVYSMILNDRSNLDSELGEVIGINNSRLTIMGDDGSKGRTFSSKTLKLKKIFLMNQRLVRKKLNILKMQ